MLWTSVSSGLPSQNIGGEGVGGNGGVDCAGGGGQVATDLAGRAQLVRDLPGHGVVS